MVQLQAKKNNHPHTGHSIKLVLTKKKREQSKGAAGARP